MKEPLLLQKGTIELFQWYILSLFLYFPQDKSEYIPAAIKLAVCLVLCVLFFRWILRVSKRQAAKAKELEDKIMGQVHSTHSKENSH
jgi:flagellar biosynthesis protein FliR